MGHQADKFAHLSSARLMQQLEAATSKIMLAELHELTTVEFHCLKNHMNEEGRPFSSFGLASRRISPRAASHEIYH